MVSFQQLILLLCLTIHEPLGAYNVDSVLEVMVKGLEEELKERLAGGRQLVANESPSPPVHMQQLEINESKDLPIKKQGASLGDIVRSANRVVKFVGRRNKKQ